MSSAKRKHLREKRRETGRCSARHPAREERCELPPHGSNVRHSAKALNRGVAQDFGPGTVTWLDTDAFPPRVSKATIRAAQKRAQQIAREEIEAQLRRERQVLIDRRAALVREERAAEAAASRARYERDGDKRVYDFVRRAAKGNADDDIPFEIAKLAESLAQRCNATSEQARTAIDRAVEDGLLRRVDDATVAPVPPPTGNTHPREGRAGMVGGRGFAMMLAAAFGGLR